MPANLNLQLISFFVILIAALVLLLTERLRNDIVAILIILALAMTHILTPAEALSGFGSEPAIVVACIFVMSAAFQQTGLADSIGVWVGRLAGRGYSRIIAVIMSSVALLSAFTHHVTTTAVMLPVTLNLSRERHIPASKLLMPLSFAASLGTCITIIGAPAFLIASDLLTRAGRPGLSIFSITPIGLAISTVGILFMLLVGRFLLPSREGGVETGSHFRLDNYFTEVKILPDSPWLGKTLSEVKANGRYHFTVAGWVRDGHPLPGSFVRQTVAAGDILMVHTTPDDMVAFRQDSGIELHAVEKFGAPTGKDEEQEVAEQLVQAVIAPRSDLIGRTLREVDFRRRYGPIVVGLWRQDGYLHQELANIPLLEGDVLVMQGDAKALAQAASDRAFLMLVPFQGESCLHGKAPVAAGIMLVTIALVGFGVLTLDIASLAGALAMVLTGCLTPRQAYRSIDRRVYVFIAGAIPLGVAMQKTGAADLLAGGLQQAVSGWSETYILLAIFVIVGLITQLMSDAATVAVFAPVALALAETLGHAPEAYVVTVAMAAVAAFLTPIGHHGNLLIYGPGGYQFGDFVRVGAPLTILVGVVVIFLAQVLWPL